LFNVAWRLWAFFVAHLERESDVHQLLKPLSEKVSLTCFFCLTLVAFRQPRLLVDMGMRGFARWVSPTKNALSVRLEFANKSFHFARPRRRLPSSGIFVHAGTPKLYHSWYWISLAKGRFCSMEHSLHHDADTKSCTEDLWGSQSSLCELAKLLTPREF
jgi:hypothetical protein